MVRQHTSKQFLANDQKSSIFFFCFFSLPGISAVCSFSITYKGMIENEGFWEEGNYLFITSMFYTFFWGGGGVIRLPPPLTHLPHSS